MDRTLVGDLEQFGTLLLRKLAGDRDLALDPIEHALCGFTFGAVVGVNPRMAQANRHAADRPPFPSRIQRDRHGRSGAKARQEQRSEEHTSELQSLTNLVCRLLLEKKKKN